MVNDHEAHDAGHGSPHEVQGAIANEHVILAIDRARCAGELTLVPSEVLHANLLAVDSWSPLAAAHRLGHASQSFISSSTRATMRCVEELRRLCAQLRERLTEASRTQSQLAEALVAEVG